MNLRRREKHTGGPKLLVSALNFGLGPVGKLASIIARMPRTTTLFGVGDCLPSELIYQPFLASCWSKDPAHLRSFVSKHALDLAVVVLDPEVASTLQDIGVSVVYVDSLPFLWTSNDQIPFGVAAYCAQRCLHLPLAAQAVLSKVKHLRWIEGILPPCLPSWSGKTDNVLVNFGGLQSPHGDGIAYIDVILPAILRAFEPLGRRKINFACSEPAASLIRNRLASVAVEYPNLVLEAKFYLRTQFHRLMADSKFLLTSPGLTTLLEASAVGVPLVMLPPQHLSQFRNIEAQLAACPASLCVNWDVAGLRSEDLEQELVRGEDHVVRVILQRIESLPDAETWGIRMAERLRAAIQNLVQEGSSKLARRIGTCGTDDVWKAISEIAMRPE